MTDALDYRFGQEPIVGLGAPDTRPCQARIEAKAAGRFGCVERYERRDVLPSVSVVAASPWPFRVAHEPVPYRRRVRLGIDG